MTATEIDVLIVGAGAVGLASAVHAAKRGLSTCVIDVNPRPGMEASTHNSGVIHAGLYYPPESLKARLCLDGRDRLYAFCAQMGVWHRRTGKLVVASRDRLAELEAIAASATAAGARAEIVDARAVRARVPLVNPGPALWSPDTGIVDASQLVRALAARASSAGAVILSATGIEGVSADPQGLTADTGRERIRAQAVINAAGLYADDVSALFGGERFRIWACRGDYAELRGRITPAITMPIYPLPEASGHGLGVHFTPTANGSVLVGPTSRYQRSKSDYESNRVPLSHFLEAGRQLIPSLSERDLRDGGSGIRAKLHPEHERFADFKIAGDSREPRLVHAAGIDSPGLTSCLAIGAMAASLAADRV